MNKDEILQKYGGAGPVHYRHRCRSFFAGQFVSDILEKEVSKMSLDEFLAFDREFLQAYYDFTKHTVREVVRGMRDAYGEGALQDPDFGELVDLYHRVRNDVYRNNYSDVGEVAKKFAELDHIRQMEQRAQELIVTVDDKTFQALDTCEVLWSGWESDDRVWVVDDDGVKKLVTSNHGSEYFTDPSFLEDRIAEYEEAIQNSRRLLNLLKGN